MSDEKKPHEMLDEIQRKLLDSRGLPKWPQMLVSGVPVTVEQAKEIIRRTDTFFSSGGGNDRHYNDKVKDMIGFPAEPESYDELGRMQKYWAREVAWRERWGVIETEYVHNSWVSCAFIYGPHGWCHPDGTIRFTDNVGKWPGTEDVYNDWAKLAAIFPFVEAGITLMDGECCCADFLNKVISFAVKDGKVTVVDPKVQDVHASYAKTRPNDLLHPSLAETVLLPPSLREHGIPMTWIEEWAKSFKERT